MADDILLDMLSPSGTVALTENTAEAATLQITATDQADGSGMRAVAMQVVLPNDPPFDPADLPGNAWLDVSETITINKPMMYDASASTVAGQSGASDLTYQIWFRDAAGNIAEPITITIPYVAPTPVETLQQVYLPLIRR